MIEDFPLPPKAQVSPSRAQSVNQTPLNKLAEQTLRALGDHETSGQPLLNLFRWAVENLSHEIKPRLTVNQQESLQELAGWKLGQAAPFQAYQWLTQGPTPDEVILSVEHLRPLDPPERALTVLNAIHLKLLEQSASYADVALDN